MKVSFQGFIFLNFYIIVLVSFPSGGCVDENVGNRTSYQGYDYEYDDYFLQDHKWTVTHFMNGEKVCFIIRTISNAYIFLKKS